MRTLLAILIGLILLAGCSNTPPYAQIKEISGPGGCTTRINITDVAGVKVLNEPGASREVTLVILVKNNPANTAWRMINLYADANEISFEQQPDLLKPSEVFFCLASGACDKDGECYGTSVLVLVQHGLADIH